MIADISLDYEECKSKCRKYGSTANSMCYTKRGNDQKCDGKNIQKLSQTQRSRDSVPVTVNQMFLAYFYRKLQHHWCWMFKQMLCRF